MLPIKSYMVIIVIILTMVFIGCSTKNNQPISNTISTTASTTSVTTTILPESEECKSVNDVYDCLQNLSLEQRNIEYCRIIPDDVAGNVVRNNCIYDRLIESGITESDLCTKNIQRQTTMNFCYNFVAFNSDNYNSCSLITNKNGKNWCYANIAIHTNNIKNCDLIFDNNIQEFCKAVLNSDSFKCDKLNISDSVKDACFEHVAIKKSDIGMCLNIQEDLTLSICEGTIIKDSNKCDNLKGYDKDWCYGTLAIRLNDISICNKIVGVGISADTQINNCKALVSKDSSYCEKINWQSSSMKNDCRVNVNLLNRNKLTLNYNGPSTKVIY